MALVLRPGKTLSRRRTPPSGASIACYIDSVRIYSNRPIPFSEASFTSLYGPKDAINDISLRRPSSP